MPQKDLLQELADFKEFGTATRQIVTNVALPQIARISEVPLKKRGNKVKPNSSLQPSAFAEKIVSVPTFINEFWTSKQRAASSLHEVSYRACFKPQLPRFFIERLTQPGDHVYDPFMGRGTTLIEAALLGRVPLGCDINPLSSVLVRPRLSPPVLNDVSQRLDKIDFNYSGEIPDDLLVFYHPDTLRQIIALKNYLIERRSTGAGDNVDDWICMVALNRLTGHSCGFFSVYTLPPNQAVSVVSQKKINERRKQTPPKRNVPAIILKKSKQLLGDCHAPICQGLQQISRQALLLTRACSATPEIKSQSVRLVVTSPPFLNIVDYAGDNWLRCWFLGLDAKSIEITTPRRTDQWQEAMAAVFRELARVVAPGGHVAFEVGEVHKGKLKLEEIVLPCGIAAGLEPVLVLINDQEFTKTANCWGVDNNSKGTNSNRIVLFRKS
jgi:hypothetical protein